MKNKKVFVLLPDGVGLRNFAYSNFYQKGIDQGFDIVFWNATPFDLRRLGLSELRVPSHKPNPFTDILKKAKKEIELTLNIKRDRDNVYDSYRFPYIYSDLKTTARILLIKLCIRLFSGEKGLVKLRKRIASAERNSPYYRDLHEILSREKPDLLFSTTQRVANAIAPVLAAQDLGVPTAAFIFSWDNLPKATLDVEPDYYFVWSDHMKAELLKYHSFVRESQIIVTGTPQFEIHRNKSKLISRENFCRTYGLDPDKKYICYSGDDVTTSPNDPLYLADLVSAVRQLNTNGHNLGIVFRRCPVDFSNRFESVLSENKDIITPIDPKWQKGERWNTILPTIADLELQMNTIAHTEFVINLGSSMVFDYVSFGKPCAFVSYDYPITSVFRKDWSVAKTYNFVHFRSMPSRESVVWLNSAAEIPQKLEYMLAGAENNVKHAYDWFAKINREPAEHASQRILDAFSTIISKKQDGE